MSKTLDNLMDAFAGESQANRKYLAYAQVADKEGKPQIAKLFRAAAAAETGNKDHHGRTLIPGTADNLLDAAEGENYEWTDMYAQMAKDAKEEGNEKVAKYFGFACSVEEVHANLYKKAIEDAQAFKGDYYICPVCGYTHEGPMTGSCPVCGAKGANFIKVD